MFLNQLVKDLVGNFLNLIIVELFDEPVEYVSLYSKISSVDVWNVLLEVDQSWQHCYSKTERLLLVSNLGTEIVDII